MPYFWMAIPDVFYMAKMKMKKPQWQVLPKIMTCIVALEYAKENILCTTSAYAASMPDGTALML